MFLKGQKEISKAFKSTDEKTVTEHPNTKLPPKIQQKKWQPGWVSRSTLGSWRFARRCSSDSLSRMGALRSLTLVTFFSLVPLQMSCKRAPRPRCSSLLSLGGSVFAWRKRETKVHPQYPLHHKFRINVFGKLDSMQCLSSLIRYMCQTTPFSHPFLMLSLRWRDSSPSYLEASDRRPAPILTEYLCARLVSDTLSVLYHHHQCKHLWSPYYTRSIVLIIISTLLSLSHSNLETVLWPTIVRTQGQTPRLMEQTDTP